ncbi:hypothetical protein TUA1478L_01660 [Lactiplantibacillus plantarum]
MQLAKSFEQAACVLVLLATQQPEIPLTADVLHERIGGSASYIRKIIRKLVVAGLVTSTSGNNGGVHLARSPEDISITDVVAAIEGRCRPFRIMVILTEYLRTLNRSLMKGRKWSTGFFRERINYG